MPGLVFERHQKKESLIDDFLRSVNTDLWGFQPSIDEKARSHLENLLLDNWPREHDRQKREKEYLESLNITDEAVNMDAMLRYELASSVNTCYELIFREYFRFVYVTKQKDANAGDEADSDKAASCLLMLMIYGQVDVCRMQNHINIILYHAAKIKLAVDRANEALAHHETTSEPVTSDRTSSPVPSTVVNIRTVHLSTDIERSELIPSQLQAEIEKSDGVVLPRRAITLQELPNQTSPPPPPERIVIEKLGPFITAQAKYIYKFMGAVINKNLRNEEYFDWDDVNDLCWTPGFVEDYIFEKGENGKDFNPSFARVFQLDRPEFKYIKDQIEGRGYSGTDKAIQAEVAKSKADFAKMWKTYFDRAGGILGWRGYLTLHLHFAEATYFQVFTLVICLMWFVQFRVNNFMYLGLTCTPFILSIALFVVKYILWNRTNPESLHPYRREVPRRDARKQGFITSRIQKYQSWRQLLTSFFVLALFLFYILGGRYLLLETVVGPTSQFEFLFYSTIQSKFTAIQLTEMLLNMFSLAILWAMIFSVFWILPPIFLNVWVGVFGFIQGWFLGVSRIKSWGAFVRKFHHASTIFVHFRAKILAEELKGSMHLSDEETARIEWSWAMCWNSIVQDMYDSHMLSDKERQNFMYVLKTGADHGYAIIKKPDISEEPKCELCAYHLMRFMNNLWMGSVPTGPSARVIDMKRLVVFTPVYKEKILYSWEELVKPGNTNISFLRHLLIKYPHDWHCFKEREFPVGNRLRHTVDYLEEKVMAGIDITTHRIHKSSTTDFMKELICSWASLRFQPVARTVKGFMRIPKALALMLRLQNPDMDDEEIRHITRQKFGYIVGAQLFEREMWMGASNFAKLNEEQKAACIQEYSEYTGGLNRLTKLGDSMMKIAFLNQDNEKRWWSNLITWDDNKKEFSEVYRLESFGNFSSLGQGKPANQAFMCQFFDGSFVQAIDCNMDSTLTQSFFVPNVLLEFSQDPTVKIVGCPEFLFTYAWSQAAFASAFTERVFGTIVQRVYSLLNQRMHYGHPDFINGMNMMFTTGMSKMNYVSEDIFTGFDNLLNGGRSILADYIEVGKARDVCMLSTSKFNRKISGGAAQLSNARFPKWILTSRHLTFPDKLLYCYTVVSFYQNTLFTVVSTLILYVTRIIILLFQLVLTFIQNNDTSTLTAIANGAIQTSILQITNSLFIVQLSIALSVTGILQNILDKGIIKGIIDYLLHAVMLVIYGMFHLMNICYYFHYGFSQSAKYIASGRVTGLEHVSIVGIYKTFKTTHFVTAGFFTLLQFIAIAIGGSYQFLLYNTVLCLVLVWGPFLFNAGSFPVYCSYDSWKRLTAENLHTIKTWIFEQCKIDDVEGRIKKDKRYKQITMEYDYKIDKDDSLAALELDLELCVIDPDPDDEEAMKQDLEHNFYSKKNRERAYSISTLDTELVARRVKMEQQREKLLKEKIMDELDRSRYNALANRGLFMKLLDSIKRKSVRIFRKTYQTVAKIPMYIEQGFLLFILVGLKWCSYVIMIWKIVAPWSSAPNYEVVYVDVYEEKNTEDRLINIQRLLKILFLKKYTAVESGEIGTTIAEKIPKTLANAAVMARIDHNVIGTQTSPLPPPSKPRAKNQVQEKEVVQEEYQYRRMRPLTHDFEQSTKHIQSSLFMTPTSPQDVKMLDLEEIKPPVDVPEEVNLIKNMHPRTHDLLLQFAQAMENETAVDIAFDDVIESMRHDMGLAPLQIRELCSHALDDTFFDDVDEDTKQLRRALVLLDLYYYLKLFQKKTNFALVKASQVINPPENEPSVTRSTFSKKQKEQVKMEKLERSQEFKLAAKRLLNACQFMVVKYNVPFELIMFDPDHPERNYLRERVHGLCRDLIERSFQLSFAFLIEAKRQFKHFNTYVQQMDIYGNNYSSACYNCEVKRKRLIVVRKALTTLRQSLNFVERLVEADPNNKITSNTDYMEEDEDDDDPSTIDENEMKIIDNDNGESFMDQCFPVHEPYDVIENMRQDWSLLKDDTTRNDPYYDEPAPEELPRIKRLWKPYYDFLKLSFNADVAAQVSIEKEALMENLLELIRDLMTEQFVELSDDCAEMLSYLKKQEKVIKLSHIHKDTGNRSTLMENMSMQSLQSNTSRNMDLLQRLSSKKSTAKYR